MRNQVVKCGRRLVLAVAVFGILSVGKQVKAAETATLRVISTTDIHNQINNEDYDVAGKNTTKSLARLNTMIKGARAEMTQGGSITVDVGDSIYGYGAETIMGDELQPNNNLQPVFYALSRIGYDAITLGNHDFDYGYTFIKNQIEQAGLSDVCLVANVKDMGTGKYPWKRTKMITRELTTAKGNTVSVKIGIVGVTRAEMSTYYDYNGILQGESLLKTVRTQAATLKKQGADVVVVLAHCAIGTANPDDSAQDAGYALTKLDDVDCVMLGHQHRNYPSNDTNVKSFYELPNTDAETGLMNGKPVVMVADHAAGIGIADMTLKIDGDDVSVVAAETEVRRCNSLVMEDPEIQNLTSEYDSLIKDTFSEILARVKEGSAITGYFAPLEDNYAVQLNNEAKIQYGLKYIHSSAGAAYSDYHVIAATKYYLDGNEGRDDFIEVGNNFTMKDVLNVQEYKHNNNYVYWITGAQLREWLEWSVSIFAQKDDVITSDKSLAELMQENDASSVLADNYLNNWETYTIFDGLEYEIDASVPPRYDAEGTMLHADSRRITKLTYNGTEVTDDTKFIIVWHHINQQQTVIRDLINQKLTAREFRSVTYFKEYVAELGSFGELGNDVDNNWSVSFGDTSAHIVRSSSLSELYATLKPWYRRTLKVTEDCAYYLADLSTGTKTEDTSGPLLVISPSTREVTNQDITIYIQASDSSGISEVLYLQGQYTEDEDEAWKTAPKVEDNKLTVSANGIYCICAIDGNGNKTIKSININNINTGVLQVPTVDKFTNKKTTVTGESQPGLSVHISIGEQVYNTTVDEKGNYTCDVGKQNAGQQVLVYVSDSEGRISENVTTKVLRRGPNAPSLNTVTNKTVTLTGKINDKNTTILAYIGKKVYVPKTKGTTIYKECAKYSKDKTIVKAISYSVEDDVYYIKVPAIAAKKKVTIFSVDSSGKCSLTEAQVAKEEAPNQPEVDSICEVERCVSGRIPEATKICKVTVTDGSQSFTAKSDEDGTFLVKTKGFKAGTVVKVSASDSQAGKTRTSIAAECVVDKKEGFVVSSSKSKISVKTIDNYSTTLQGKVKGSSRIVLNFGETSAVVELNSDGTFDYTLPNPLAGGESFYITRYNKNTGALEEVKMLTVKTKQPKVPEIMEKKVSKKAQAIRVVSGEQATVVVKTAGKKIKVTECRYNATKKKFIYTVELPKGSGRLFCHVKNSAGTSKPVSLIRK